ncbi:uncharacterized protein LOC118438806 [Folsomia candida]|nr:uncharacterized protein LOC118438806 [Folsomia candida]
MGPSGGNNEKQHFFSDCTDSAIRDFLRLDGSNCLRTLEGNLTWPFGPAIPGSGWSGMEPIDVLPECKAIFNSNEAYLGEEVLSSCTTQCKVPIPGGTRFTYIPGIENGPCGNGEGRCFRGRCRNPTSTIHHKASNLCMTRSNRFTFQDNPVLMPCPRSIMVKTPLDGYLLTTTSDGIIFSSPYTYDNFNENSEKCLQSGPQGSILETARCELSSTSQLWEIRKSSPPCKVFDLIVNKATGLCLAPISNEIGSQIVHRPCDEGSNEILWWVEPGEDWGTGSFFANLPPMCSTG